MNLPVATDENTYPGLPVIANEISAFRYVQPLQTFILSLKDRERIIRFEPDEVQPFIDWLNTHYIREYKT
ncbi:hypothetical protein HGH93_11960 [Chitinophaga polysaccharea]|uniref:hypothetical protein n=1 Tax=Chitinophaga polysaccharea TaxID=1293035 RepID=UPI0014550F74|nr:hypothetical protein [Chitinophaga polysaccharea]NLR58821.1 hypothetical protein [Chitinophaga polysaccharea]